MSENNYSTNVQKYGARLRMFDNRSEKYYFSIFGLGGDDGGEFQIVKLGEKSTGYEKFRNAIREAKSMEFTAIKVIRYAGFRPAATVEPLETVTIDITKEAKPSGFAGLPNVDAQFAPFGGLAGFVSIQQEAANQKGEIERLLDRIADANIVQSDLREELKKIQAEKEALKDANYKLQEQLREEKFNLSDKYRELERSLNDKLRDAERAYQDKLRETERNAQTEKEKLEKKATLFAGIGSGIEQLGMRFLGNQLAGMQGTQGAPENGLGQQPDVYIEQEPEGELAENKAIADKVHKWFMSNPLAAAKKVFEIIKFATRSEGNVDFMLNQINNDNYAEIQH